ncbi:MAG: amidohydrolase [Bacteroidales bacterium]|nr:amidohydrolase [Bacteroidales bacterium]
MSSLRKDLHNHPGVSGDEHYAHDRIVEQLQSLSPDALHTHVGGYGVVAYFATQQFKQSSNQAFKQSSIQAIKQSSNQAIKHSSNQAIKHSSNQAIALRADIDALPIGHRCGHDGHTATLLRLAQLLSQQRLSHRGVVLIFQPEEETGLGAQKIIDSGVLQHYDIRCILAVHNIPDYPLNQVLLSNSTFAAASSGVVYRLTGRPTHASTPELGLNPGLAVAEIVQRMHQFNNPSNQAFKQSGNQAFKQSTLIAIRLGQPAFGTSAGDAEVMFTLRAFTNDTMQRLLDDAHGLVAEVAQRYGLQECHELVEPFRATENTPHVVAQLQAIAEREQRHVTHLPQPFRWSEDFSNYLVHYPGALLGIGAGENHVELHHPDYDFPDEIIEPTANLLYNFAKEIQLA